MPIQNGPLKVARQPNGQRVLLKPLLYSVRLTRIGPILVPGGFPTDYSSDPIGLMDWSTVDIAGVVHDWLYRKQFPPLSRRQDDAIWFEIARSGIRRSPYPLAILGWLGMRIFGWRHKAGYPLRWKIIMGSLNVVLVIGAVLAVVHWWPYVAAWILMVLIGLMLLRNFCR